MRPFPPPALNVVAETEVGVDWGRRKYTNAHNLPMGTSCEEVQRDAKRCEGCTIEQWTRRRTRLQEYRVHGKCA